MIPSLLLPIWFRPWMLWAVGLLATMSTCGVYKHQRNTARTELQTLKVLQEAQKLRMEAAFEKAEAIGVHTSAVVKEMENLPLPTNDAEAKQQALDAAIRIRNIRGGLR